jgi:hypothetical protein
MYPLFEKLEKASLKAQPVRQNVSGMGKTVMLDYEHARGMKFSSPKDLRQKWMIAPSTIDGTEVKPTDKLNIEVELGPEMNDFLQKCQTLDSFVMETAFAHKTEWFGDKNAKRMDSIEALKLTYTKIISEGKTSKTGTKYPDGVKFKIEGWAPYVESVILREDGPGKGLPKNVVWKPRLVDELNPLGIKDNETKFYLFDKKDPVTGVDDYIYKVPVVDASMTQKKDASGNGIWRYVGPQDCVPNSRLRIVFACNRVWITDIRFGISLIAKEIWIKPPPPPTVQKLEGVRIVAKVDVANAIKLLNTMQTTEANLDDDVYEDEDLHQHSHTDAPSTISVTSSTSATSASASAAAASGPDAPVPDEDTKKSPEAKRRKKEPKPTVVVDPL